LFGFGGLLFNYFKGADRATRVGILRILLVGDFMHLYTLYTHRNDSFWGTQEILFNILGTMPLLLARLAFFMGLGLLSSSDIQNAPLLPSKKPALRPSSKRSPSPKVERRSKQA